MSDLFQFPELRIERDRMIMFRTPFPKLKDEQMMRMAKSFGVRGKLRNTGSRFIIRDRRSILEFYQASDSVWWTRIDKATEEPKRSVKLPEEKEAIELSQAFLREQKLYDNLAQFSSVTYTEASQMDRGQKETEDFRIAQHVNFTFNIDGLPVMGPGGKIQITFGSRKRVIEAYKFWRKPVKDREMKIIDIKAAINLLRQDHAFVDLRGKKSKVIFHSAQLGYFALPPREAQGYLIPVYAFQGTVTTPHLESYEFVKNIVAVKIKPEEVKQLGAVFTEASAVFSG